MDKSITRIITGTIMGFIMLFSLLSGGLPLFIITMLVVIFATREYVSILKNKGFYPSIKVILVADAIFAILAYLIGWIARVGSRSILPSSNSQWKNPAMVERR